MTGYVVYAEKSDPDTVRTHGITGILSWADGVLVLDTADGPRTHHCSEYTDFGIFPLGPSNQVRPQ